MDFVAADMPHANRLTVGIMALVAEEERRMISARTKAALAVAKARGTVLGGYRGHTITAAAGEAGRRSQAARADARLADLMPVLDELRMAGVTSLGGIARALNVRGIPAARGGVWTATQVRRLQAAASYTWYPVPCLEKAGDGAVAVQVAEPMRKAARELS